MSEDAPKTRPVAGPVMSFLYTGVVQQAIVMGCMFVVATALTFLLPRQFQLLSFLFLPLMALQMVPGRAFIGDDGLRVQWLGLRSFVPWSDVHSVVVDQVAPGARFFLKDGKQRLVGVPSYYRAFNRPSETARFEAVAFVTEIEQALARYRALQAEAPAPALAIEEERMAFAQWRELVRGMAESGGSYRDAAIDRAALRDVLRRATTRASVRAAAAYVLTTSKAKTEEDVACIEAARQGTANERLRVALDALETERIDDALVALHREDEVRRRL